MENQPPMDPNKCPYPYPGKMPMQGMMPMHGMQGMYGMSCPMMQGMSWRCPIMRCVYMMQQYPMPMMPGQMCPMPYPGQMPIPQPPHHTPPGQNPMPIGRG